MTAARRRGLLRLALLVGLVVWLAVLALRGVFSNGSHGGTTTATGATRHSLRVRATITSMRLPIPLHGATAASVGARLLVIGGADRADVSTDRVFALDPSSAKLSPAGTLVQPLHDAAAATLGSRILVFGGGASTTYSTVQKLVPGGNAEQTGRLPVAASDLSGVSAAGAAYVLGGYDGARPLASVFRTTTGRTFTTVARLPTAVRYTAVAALGERIYAFGGELGSGADTDQIQEYDAATGRASVAGHLPQGVSHASAVVLNGSIFLAGGRRAGSASDRILRFDPGRGTVRPAGR